MAALEENNQLNEFQQTGVYRLHCSNAFFIDPVRILNRSYTQHRVSPTRYYSRFFLYDAHTPNGDEAEEKEEKPGSLENSRKRKRKKRKGQMLNAKEQLAELRHRLVRPLLLKAHGEFLAANDLLRTIQNLRTTDGYSECPDWKLCAAENPLIELGKVWQAPMFEITLKFDKTRQLVNNEDYSKDCFIRSVPAFNNLVLNDKSCDLEAEFEGFKYVIPRGSRFYMSDLGQIHNLIPDDPNFGFNLIIVDPPWENKSAHKKSMYPTLPNRYFLGLPVQQLTHREGALVALWVTNKEKFWNFIENELFPAWGVEHVATFYWLKVKSDGNLVCELDLFHRRPYECLLLGYSTSIKDSGGLPMRIPNKVIISIPGDHSRKPPVGEMLMEYSPGTRPVRCIDLFARELSEGWASWGNEPLHFQEFSYFVRKKE